MNIQTFSVNNDDRIKERIAYADRPRYETLGFCLATGKTVRKNNLLNILIQKMKFEQNPNENYIEMIQQI